MISLPLLPNVWTSLGSGPLEIRAARGTVCYAISDSPPAPTERGFTLAAGKPKSIQATGQVWALTQSPLGATVLYQPSALKHRDRKSVV